MRDTRMIKYPLILGTIALVAGLLLALVYNITAPVIEKNKNKRENAVVVEMFGENAKITDISDSLESKDRDSGITSVLKVDSKGSKYYVYKITIKDSFDGDESSFVVAIDSLGKISKLKFTSTGDSYASKYASDSYITNIVGKNELSGSDVVSGATKTGDSIVSSINAALNHEGRSK